MRSPLKWRKLLTKSLNSGAVLVDARLSPRRKVSVDCIEERTSALARDVPLPDRSIVTDLATKEVAESLYEPDLFLRHGDAPFERASTLALVDSRRPNDVDWRSSDCRRRRRDPPEGAAGREMPCAKSRTCAQEKFTATASAMSVRLQRSPEGIHISLDGPTGTAVGIKATGPISARYEELAGTRFI